LFVHVEADHDSLPVIGELPAAQIVTDLCDERRRAIVFVVNN
jgi:hypothetical protein